MSRSGYSEDCDNVQLWRGAVKRGINGKRGKTFLTRLAADLDAMPVKRLITGYLVDAGEACTMGVALLARGFSPEKIMDMDVYDYDKIAEIVDIPHSLVQEIEYWNDGETGARTPEERWMRMRRWVAEMLKHGDPDKYIDYTTSAKSAV